MPGSAHTYLTVVQNPVYIIIMNFMLRVIHQAYILTPHEHYIIFHVFDISVVSVTTTA